MTDIGDIIYESATNTRLVVGESGQMLTEINGKWAWITPTAEQLAEIERLCYIAAQSESKTFKTDPWS